MKNKYLILFLLFIGFFPYFIPSNIGKINYNFQNQTKINEKSTFKEKVFPPKLQDSSTSKIQFNSSESINRSYSKVGPFSSELAFETPISYNTFDADINFQVVNESLNIVEDSYAGGYARNQQAQSFEITKTVNLLGFSLHIYGKTAVYIDMEVRNNSYSGESIYSFSPLLNSSEWLNISFSEQIILTPGKYFLWMQKIPGAQYSSWEKSLSSENSTDTWEFTTSWQPTDFDLALKIKTSELINPEDINMKVNNVPVSNTDNGQGFVKIKGEINSSFTFLTVSTDDSVSFFYSMECSFYRNSSIQYNFQIQQDWIDWNLTLNSSYFESPYFEYRINITGIKDDYNNIQVYNGTNVVGFSSISPGIIEFSSEATHIIFRSLNYINSVTLDDTMQIGSNVSINVSTNGYGDLYAYLIDNDNKAIIYQDSVYNVSNQNFQWYLDPTIDSKSITIEIFFNGSNEIGYYSNIFNVSRLSEIIAYPIHVNSLDNLSISCLYWDPYKNQSIADGTVSYNFGDLSGSMEFDKNGNYSRSIDLNQYSILPGQYSILLIAEKENYGKIQSEIELMINPRIINLELSKSRTSITPRKTIEFDINLKDIGNHSYLLRPVDLQVRIFYSGNHSNTDLVYNKILEGINNNEAFSWKVPSIIEKGSYDIVVDVLSDYYSGNLSLNHAIIIKPSNFWLISIPIFIGLVTSVVIGYYIKKAKVKQSLLGLMILHDNGAPLAEKISYKIQRSDSALVSGAFIGILSIIKEITGSRLRTIEIEGGYVNLVHGKSFWLIIFLKNNPLWIEKDILKLRDEIQLEYGEKIKNFHGKPLNISMDWIIKKYFNIQIHTEPVKSEK